MRFLFGACSVMLGVAALSLGCKPVGGGGPEGGGVKQGGAATAACGAEGMIDDMEDQNNQVIVQDGRSGYWYTFVDEGGSTIQPPKGETFQQSAGGANGSAFAARVWGQVGPGGIVYCGLGVNLTDPKDAYDASKYGGLSFTARKQGGAGKVRLKIPDVSTDPQGGVCKECFNDFGANMELTDAWTEYVLPFHAAKQEESWGSPHVPSITPSKLYSVQWQVNTPGVTYDIWVDNVKFVGCEGGGEAPAAGGGQPAAPAAAAPAATPPAEAEAAPAAAAP